MAMDLKGIEKLIKEGIPDALVEIQDLAGDVTIILRQFLHQNLIIKVK